MLLSPIHHAALLVCVVACASGGRDEHGHGGPGGKGDYYGTDDRQQILDAQDPRVVGWAKASAIVVNRHQLLANGAGRVTASGVSTLGEFYNLCSGERFTNEPKLGFCSSYLVEPDVVATAGHCFDAHSCDDMAFVFDYYKGGASADVSSIPASNVFACREVIARQYDGTYDYALVRLDRPATGRTPFKLQPAPPAVGARVVLLGFPSGIYAKVDLAGTVVRHEGHRIRTSSDSFPGHSGGVMIDFNTGRAFGVHIEGSRPSYVGNGTCQAPARCERVTPDEGTCQGAIETSVAVFSSGVGTDPPPPPRPASCEARCGDTDGTCACDLDCAMRGNCCADFAAICEPGSTTRTCLPGGAPCDQSIDCSSVIAACDTVNAFSESFNVAGKCVANRCADHYQLAAQACADMEPFEPGQVWTVGWWAPDCEPLP